MPAWPLTAGGWSCNTSSYWSLVPGVHEMRALNSVIPKILSDCDILCVTTSVVRAIEMIWKNQGNVRKALSSLHMYSGIQ
jgi:hypothetical protein